MSAAVEPDGGLKGDDLLDSGRRLVLRVQLGKRLFGGVQVGDVRLVVLLVVKLHDVLDDMGLEGLRCVTNSDGAKTTINDAKSTHIVGVGKLGKRVLTSRHDDGNRLGEVASSKVAGGQTADRVSDVACERHGFLYRRRVSAEEFW